MTGVLAIGAHPDDVEIFAGGTLARFARLGQPVFILHLTRGEASTRGTPESRRVEAAAAADALGAEMQILDLGDGHLRDDDRTRDAVIDVIRQRRPRLLIGPYPSDEHPDHAVTGQIVKAAWYLAGIEKAGAPTRPPHRPDALWFYASHEPVEPNLIVALDHEDVDRLDRSVRCYGSQFHDPDSSEPETRLTRRRYTDSILARRVHHGSRVDRDFGEAFLASRPLVIDDPTRWLG